MSYPRAVLAAAALVPSRRSAPGAGPRAFPRGALVTATRTLLIVLAVLAGAGPAEAQLRAGAAAIDITPTLCEDAAPDDGPEQFDAARGCFRWVHLAGFSPYVPFRDDSRLATGIHDPIWARALALEDASGDTVVIVAADLPGLGRKHTGPVRRRVARAHGIPAERVVLHSTHTHSAPDGSGYWSTLMPGHNGRYTAQLREWLYAAVRDALAAMQPATLRTVTTTHPSCVDRDTGAVKADPDCSLPAINNEIDDPRAAYDRFLVQRDLRDPIVRNTRIVAAELTAEATGETIATVVNWHNHPDTLGSANRLLSSDYPHYLREYLERTRGGVAIFVAGTVGNQMSGLRGTPVPLRDASGRRVFETSPDGTRRPVLVTDGWEKIRSTGYEIAHAAGRALDGAAPVPAPRVAVATARFETPVDNVIHLLGTWSVWHHDVEPEERLRYRWPDCWGLLGCVQGEVSLVEIGDLSILTAPGEIDPAYALGRPETVADYGAAWDTWRFPAMPGVDHLMPGRHHAFVGSAQDYLSYLMPPSDNTGWWNFDHPNHYEEWVTIGSRFGEDVRRAWLDLLAERARRGP